MPKKILIGFLCIVIVAISFALSNYLIRNKKEPGKDNQKHNTTYVKVEKVTYKKIKSNIAYRGRVTAFDQISLSSEVQGKILQGDVRFKEGQTFKKGQILLRIYKNDVEAALKANKSTFLQTISGILPDLHVDFPSEYEKWASFFSKIEVAKPLPALPKINSEKEKIFLASNSILSSYYDLQKEEIILQRYVIRAPFTGVFTSVTKEIGAIANSGNELANIARTDKVEINVPVFPDDVKQLEPGDKAQVKIADQFKEVAIARISNFVDESSQSVSVYLTYNCGRKNDLLQGSYVDINFTGKELEGFEIPREALVQDQFVYELVEGQLKKRKAEIVYRLSDTYIISGLQEGKTIVTESISKVNTSTEYKGR